MYTKKTNKLVLFSILRHNLSKFVTQMGLCCSKQLDTTFSQYVKKSLHITFKEYACEEGMKQRGLINDSDGGESE